MVRNVEKELTNNLDIAMKVKKTKLLDSFSFDELNSKKR